MIFTLIAVLTIGCYLCNSFIQTRLLIGSAQQQSRPYLTFAYSAVFLHAVLLYHWIDVGLGQNLSLFNVLSQVLWFAAALSLLLSFHRRLENLMVVIAPIAALSISLVLLFPSMHIINTHNNEIVIFHILLSLVTFSVLIVSALQAALLTWQEKMLRHKNPAAFLKILPPLEAMEKLLFQIIWVGFALLTAVLFSSAIIYPHTLFTVLLDKTLLTFFAWAVFAFLLFGHYYFGWRGKMAIRGTFVGVFLILLLTVLSSLQ